MTLDENIKEYHLCYLAKPNRKTYALNMMLFGCETFKSAKHIDQLDVLKKSFVNSKTKKEPTQEELHILGEFILTTVVDWFKIIVCFENFMKAVLLLEGYLIHKIDRNDKFLKHLPHQTKVPIKLDQLRNTYNFSKDIKTKSWCLEGINFHTLNMSTLLSSRYQEVINLPINIRKTITSINKARNELHFYHTAKNSYGPSLISGLEEMKSFVDNEIMNLYSHLIKDFNKLNENTDNISGCF